MKLTTLFRLRKPDGTDPVNIEDFNDNFDVIDEELGKRLESTGNASDMTAAFAQASTRTNLKTGEKISASFGKIMKWFADMKTVAFSGSYSDLSNKPSIPSGAAASQAVANNCTTTAAGSVLDARQGKVLMDKTNQLSSDLTSVAGQVNDILYLLSARSNPYVVSATRRSQGGVVPFTYAELNCTERPSAIFVTTQSFRGSCQYDYENSNDGYVRLYFWDADGNTPPDSEIDFCIAVYP